MENITKTKEFNKIILAVDGSDISKKAAIKAFSLAKKTEIPEHEIIKIAHKNDLIIMGCKGHSSIEQILVGSVSDKMLHHSESTVMIVR